jgi:hypothetical protein
MCVDVKQTKTELRMKVFAEGEIRWWWKDNATIISEAASETKG